MTMPSFTTLVPILQLAIGPVILISGVGLLLLTLTNRFGRMVDRSRLLARDLSQQLGSPQSGALQSQIDILHRRAAILRFSILCGATTVLLVAVLILVLFLSALMSWEAGWLIVGLFCVSQLALIGSMAAFIRDMNLSLDAFRLEIKH
ncbi:MAG TPA: DUF2721 domain-containing protein [Opitutaceae bacterium]|jgi:hypothetical protein|nr:DUF2721 domain-containing protein [Opitutaceae bacterium]HRE06652.1 DUF2721 domain-containing protein [Opitutaceae bacterium]